MTEPGRRPNFLGEMHRRSVWQVITVYGVGSWFALEVVQGIVEAGNLPDWLPGMALVLLIIGFPMVIATAIIQQGWSRQREAGLASVAEPQDASEAEAADPDTAGPSLAAPPEGSTAPEDNLAAGTGSLDRPSTRPSTAHQLFTWRNALMGGVAAFALWGVVATVLLMTGRGAPVVAPAAADASERLRSVAVLPFSNLSPDPDNAFFADGIHEDVLTQLSKVGELTVISRTSVLSYRDTERPLAEVAQELGVGALVEGSVRRAGDNVRITAQLIDAETDAHLWADNFDRQLSAANLFAIQSEIAQRITDALAATLTPAEEERITRNPTGDLEAYDFYLQARRTYQLYTEGANDEAIRLFNEAIARDPDYADAWAGLADAYGQRVQRYGFAIEWADSAELVARHALQLEPDLPQAHKALALALNSQGRTGDGLEAILRAVELDPNYSEAINNTGVAYFNLGRWDDGLRYYKRAYRLNPTTGFASTNVAYMYAFLGMLPEAEERAHEVLRLQPGNQSAVGVLRIVDQMRGDYGAALERSRSLLEPGTARLHIDVASDAYLAHDFETAEREARETLRLAPGSTLGNAQAAPVVLGVALMRLGDIEAGRRYLQEFRGQQLDLIEAAPENATTYFNLAAIDAALGETEAALDWMESAYERGYRFTLGLDVDPAFDSVRDHPRWQAVVTRMHEDVAVMRANVQREEAGAATP